MRRRGCPQCAPGSSRRLYLHHGQLYCAVHLPLESLPLWTRAQVLQWRCQTLRQEGAARRAGLKKE